MKKLFISIILSLIISGILYFIYLFTNIEKNHYIFIVQRNSFTFDNILILICIISKEINTSI